MDNSNNQLKALRSQLSQLETALSQLETAQLNNNPFGNETCGGPDMRLKINRNLFLPPRQNMNGKPDMRFKVNRELYLQRGQNMARPFIFN